MRITALRSRVRARLARRGSLRADQRGSAVVEFALVVIPFLGLLFGIMAQCLNFFYQQVLDTAATDVARLVTTGQAQASSLTQAQFKQKLCDRLTALPSCSSRLQVDIRTFSKYSGTSFASPITNGAVTWTPSFTMGKAGELVIMRVIYTMPIATNFLASNTSNLNGNNRLLMSTQVFKNEPFVASGT